MTGFLLFLAAAAVEPLTTADARVATVAWRLQTAGVPLCSKVVRLPGFSIQTLDQYAPGERDAVRQASGLGDLPAVAAVVPGSGAAQAGLRVGDAIEAADGVALPLVGTGRASFATAAAAEQVIERAAADGTVTLMLAAGRQMAVHARPACASRVQLVPQKGLNAGADGTYVQVGGKLYDFVENDDELAAVIAHELAHNILGHRERLDADKVSRGLFAGLGKNGKRLREAELEADRLSVWLMARAGYDPVVITPFWQRLRKQVGSPLDGTHPGWTRRSAVVADEIATVRAAKAAGQPLVPPSQPPIQR